MHIATSFGAQPKVNASGGCRLVESGAESFSVKLQGESGQGRLWLNYDGKPLDLSAFSHFSIGTRNRSRGQVEVRVKVSSDSGNKDRQMGCRYFLKAKQDRELKMLMYRKELPETSPWIKCFSKTKALPGYQKKWIYLEPDRIGQVELEIRWNGLGEAGNIVSFSNPKGAGEFMLDKMVPDDLPQPLVDEIGQLVGQQWEGRVNDPAELPEDGKKDLAKYANNSVRSGFSQYGGWLAGPRFEATGRFYTKKVEGKWWFVDPEGYLFWSLGVTGVGFGESTLLAGREKFFPPPSSDKDPRLWTADDRELEEGEVVFNFIYSNLKKKYGADWIARHTEVCLGRMLEWGLNTCGAWPIESVLDQQRVPYTLIIHPGQQLIGAFDKVPDPFSEEFEKTLEEQMSALGDKYKGDPWNLGVFIDNELRWSNGIRLSLHVVDQDSSVPAKKGMIDFLKKKYGGIDALNKAWGTGFASFDAIRKPKGSGKGQKVFWEDMGACLDHHADTYFSKCAAAVRKHLPGHLYLGCRFHGAVYGTANPIVQRVASRHCDVVSFNIYKVSPDEFDAPPMEVDRPWLIGEFHYGTGSHGIWGNGLIPAMDMEHQAQLYDAYVGEVLRHPNFAGAHWFQWSDHVTTGRYDGENYRIGFVSIVDRPYGKLVESVRSVSQGMYQYRAQK